MKKLPQVTNAFRAARDAGRIVKYSPASHDDEEIAIVSNAAPESVKYGSGSLTANGPRVVPGIITSERPLCRSSEDVQSASRQSLLGLLGARRPSMAFVNRAHVGSELEIPRRTRDHRKREVRRDFEKWEGGGPGGPAGGSAGSSRAPADCNWTFVFDPSGRLSYYWSMVVSVAFLYNFWVMIYRFAFQEIDRNTLGWLAFDYLADLLYALDIGFHFRTGYLEEGVLQTDSTKLRQFYMNSTTFYADCLCLLPLDVLYLSVGFNSVLRCFRLVKIYRFWAFLDRTERHTNYPNVFRALSLVHHVLVVFHWNACLYHIVARNGGFGSRDWFMPECKDRACEYLQAFYWSTLALSTIGELPRPRTKGEYAFLVLQLTVGLFLFASVLGHVANIVTNVSAARKEFQARLDAVKTYMRMRRVPEHLQNKVIRWFDYLWVRQKCSDEERSVGCLPNKLKAEIAIHVHLDTLKRVEIFQNTEAGFLCELVLRLRPVLFSPGDYICRKGEVGKEMYIVNRGRLQVVSDNGRSVLATLRAGSYFGEISVLNMGTAGNRRTASVRSLGYSDLFCLNKQDMWEVLKDYPAARVRLEAIAVKRLHKYKKEPFRKVAMGRCKSTPGLIESRGKVRLEDMVIGGSPSAYFNDTTHASSRANNNIHSTIYGDAFTLNPRRLSVGPHFGYNNGNRIPVVAPPPRAPSYLSLGSTSTVSPSLQEMAPYPCTTDMYSGAMVRGPPPTEPSQEALLAEIKRLRERLVTLEADNASMSLKLSQQQWEVQHRLAEIELHFCGPHSNGSADDFERNRESII